MTHRAAVAVAAGLLAAACSGPATSTSGSTTTDATAAEITSTQAVAITTSTTTTGATTTTVAPGVEASPCLRRADFGDPAESFYLLPLVVALHEVQPDSGHGYFLNNYVFIRHLDGTVALYAHLQRRGVDVEVGQRVSQGQRIGASGNSGETGGLPHLHFGVYRTWPNSEGDDVAVNFRNADGPLDERGGLLVNRLYTALP